MRVNSLWQCTRAAAFDVLSEASSKLRLGAAWLLESPVEVGEKLFSRTEDPGETVDSKVLPGRFLHRPCTRTPIFSIVCKSRNEMDNSFSWLHSMQFFRGTFKFCQKADMTEEDVQDFMQKWQDLWHPEMMHRQSSKYFKLGFII